MSSLQIAENTLSSHNEVEFLIRHLSCPALLLDGREEVLGANDRFLAEFSLEEDDVRHRHLDHILDDLDNRGIRVFRVHGSDLSGQDLSSCYMLQSVSVLMDKEPGSVCMFLREDSSEEGRLSSMDILDFLEHANDLVQSVSPDGRFLYVNNTWKKTLGYSDEEIRKMIFSDVISDECRDQCSLLFQKVLQGQSVEHVEVSFRARDGHIVYLEGSCNCRFMDGRPVSTRGIFRDVTEKKRIKEEQNRLRKRLEKAELFESLGLMAGGIAHDYNNILMVILGFTELLKARLASTPDLLAYMEKIEKSARRADALTQQMLAFAGAGKIYLEKMDLSELIQHMKPALQAIVYGQAGIEFRLRDDLPLVEMDSSQLRQAVRNLVSNAVEAIVPAPGRITVTTGSVEAERGFFHDAVLDENLPAGRYCFVEVMDDGIGMIAEVREKAFEPFFTTKFAGRGLGLASTLGIVRGHKGAIKLESYPATGTTVTIFLPALAKDLK